MFCPTPFGALAIDVAIVGETSSSIIEQKLTANIALMRRKKYRAGVNLIVAGPDVWRNPWRDRRRWVRPITQIFFVHEQAKREKSCDCNNRVQGTMRARAYSWWTIAHELTANKRRTERKPRPGDWDGGRGFPVPDMARTDATIGPSRLCPQLVFDQLRRPAGESDKLRSVCSSAFFLPCARAGDRQGVPLSPGLRRPGPFFMHLNTK
jgi:hypothetical protein